MKCKIATTGSGILTDCNTKPKACTIIPWGGAPDVDQRTQSRMPWRSVTSYNPKLVCGGGAIEMHIAVFKEKGTKITGVEQELQRGCGHGDSSHLM
jgi:hypothetical protein